MAQFDVKGIMPPVFTPLNDDLTINCDMIPFYYDYLEFHGIKSILVGGTTGEFMTLSLSDRQNIVKAWLDYSDSLRFHIQVQVGGAPLPEVLEMARFCQANSVHSILTLPELYFKPKTVSELVYYVSLVAEAAPNLPVLYYHIPHMTGVNICMVEFVKAATEKIPNFKGLKFTSNDLSEALRVQGALKQGQALFLGADTLLAPAAFMGIKSSIGTSYNLFPKLAQEILEAVENNNVKKAKELQDQLSAGIDAHTREGAWVPAFKAGMWIVTGIDVGPPTLPQVPLTEEAKDRLESKLNDLDLY